MGSVVGVILTGLYGWFMYELGRRASSRPAVLAEREACYSECVRVSTAQLRMAMATPNTHDGRTERLIASGASAGASSCAEWIRARSGPAAVESGGRKA